jgi:acetyltransferase-like isoleucine patch superfamily enzyme
MALGLLAYDLIFVLVATGLYGLAAWTASEAFAALSRHVPWQLALFPSFLAGLSALVLGVGALTLLCPRPRPGRHKMMRGASFWGWLLRSLLRRVLFAPGLKWFLFSSNVLRFVSLRALGARVAFTANMSTDVDLLDPSLLVVSAGATLGTRSLLSGHYVEGGELVLGVVEIGPGALVAAEVLIGPGAIVGEGAQVKSRAAVGVDVRVGKGASIGGGVALEAGVEVGDGARIANLIHVPPGVRIAAGARVRTVADVPQARAADATSASPATKSAAPDV